MFFIGFMRCTHQQISFIFKLLILHENIVSDKSSTAVHIHFFLKHLITCDCSLSTVAISALNQSHDALALTASERLLSFTCSFTPRDLGSTLFHVGENNGSQMILYISKGFETGIKFLS